ncbi:hypothetical protein H9L10_08840 [Phycicoccus endophyticus]|uniref:Uncharacterized protein n=1 Tax=Phycicoccus endophyticus TaxID=1690220 RepID=A0A7G9QYM2_9MICO|nr:hypothetical protein [Phycicoccus endophyticus]NHI19353.1 hypothetical protein [Phycicoccus endophyticus]QNN48447.1 hypothetical protein H9L10_08840 [Phycicoccus endophyticus]GGL42081.1 hypothetical protein GCM10012283_25880 [Phycicoccus endophyticus]
MELETTSALIAAGAGLGGAFVGGLMTIFATTMQQRSERKSELDRERRADQARKARATEDRAREAAESCDVIFAGVYDHLRNKPQDADAAWFYHVIGDSMQQASSECVFLPSDLRQRVEEARSILREGPSLAQEHYAASEISAAHVAYEHVHDALAAWSKDLPLPPRSEIACEYVLAAERSISNFNDMYEASLGQELDIERREWRARNAEALREIGGRTALDDEQPPRG